MPKLALAVCTMENRFTASHASIMSSCSFGKDLFTMSLNKSKVAIRADSSVHISNRFCAKRASVVMSPPGATATVRIVTFMHVARHFCVTEKYSDTFVLF